MAKLEHEIAHDCINNGEVYGRFVIEAVSTEMPHFFADEVESGLAAQSVAEIVKGFGNALLAGDAEHAFHAPPQALSLVRKQTLRRTSIVDVVRSYRVGQEVCFNYAAAIILGRTGDSGELASLINVVQRLTNCMDSVTAEVVAEHHAIAESQVKRREALRLATLNTIINGLKFDLDAAEMVLDYRLNQRHVAFICTVDESDLHGSKQISVVKAVRDLWDSGRPLEWDEGTGEVAIWLPVPKGFEFTDDFKEQLTKRLPMDSRVSFGRPGYGTQGFAETYRQAHIASDVASLLTSSSNLETCPLVTIYEDVALVGVLMRDREAARLFAASELGELGQDNDDMQELRETVKTFFDCGSDQQATGLKLGIHRNTVANRLKRAEVYLGRELSERTRELDAALIIQSVLEVLLLIS